MSKIQFNESELVSFIENLVEEQSNKPLLSESKERRIGIWSDRFERKNKGKSPEVVFENFSKEVHKLSRNGISTTDLSNYLKKNERVIKEQASIGLTNKNQGVFGTVWESLREGIYRWILGFFGIKDGELKNILSMTLSNIPFTQLPKLMNCNFLVPYLTKGILEYIQRKVGTMVTGMEAGSATEVIIGNSFTNLTDNFEFVEDIERNVRDFLCGELGKKKSEVEGKLKDVEKSKKERWGSKSGDEENVVVPPEVSGQESSGLSGIAKKYFGEFMKNLGR